MSVSSYLLTRAIRTTSKRRSPPPTVAAIGRYVQDGTGEAVVRIKLTDGRVLGVVGGESAAHNDDQMEKWLLTMNRRGEVIL